MLFALPRPHCDDVKQLTINCLKKRNKYEMKNINSETNVTTYE